MSRVGQCALVATLLTAMAACSTAGSATPASEATVATSAPVTSMAATTSITSSSTTSSSTTSTTSTTIPVLDTSILADVIAAAELGPVPEGTEVLETRRDISPLDDTGCHVGWGATAPSQLPCEFGDTTSDVVIVITRDSHVAAWFGAFDEAGKTNGWKIVTVTKRGCPAADVRVYSAVNREVFDTPYPECNTWRENAIQYISDLQADLVVFPMLTRRAVVGHSGADAIQEWGAGLGRTLDAIGASGAKLLVIGDTPKTNGDEIPGCVMAAVITQHFVELHLARDCSGEVNLPAHAIGGLKQGNLVSASAGFRGSCETADRQ